MNHTQRAACCAYAAQNAIRPTSGVSGTSFNATRFCVSRKRKPVFRAKSMTVLRKHFSRPSSSRTHSNDLNASSIARTMTQGVDRDRRCALAHAAERAVLHHVEVEFQCRCTENPSLCLSNRRGWMKGRTNRVAVDHRARKSAGCIRAITAARLHESGGCVLSECRRQSRISDDDGQPRGRRGPEAPERRGRGCWSHRSPTRGGRLRHHWQSR